MAPDQLYCVIPAGGSGTRLWPLSRASHPKFLHALTGTPASLLQATVARLGELGSADTTFVVTGAAHAAAVARQLPELPDANLLIEPSPRDSCAAIGLAAAIIARRDPGGVMGSFHADQLVRDDAAFTATIRAAVAGAHQGLLMTIGITPTHAETGYGYLRCGDPADGSPVRPVAEFKEKPSAQVAEQYVESGRYLWNAGMFVWRVDAFLNELKRQQPDLYRGLTEVADVWDTPHRDAVLGEIWPELPKISIDYAVMEGAAEAGLVATVPGDFGWTDVGDFDTLGRVLADADQDGVHGENNLVIAEPKDAPILLRDSSRMIVVAQSGRLVATLGIHDVVVVDTPDALLVCARGRAQDLKSVVDELKHRGETKYL